MLLQKTKHSNIVQLQFILLFLIKIMTTTYVETDVEGVEGVVDDVDVEDAVDGGLDVGDLVYYKWAVG